MFKNHTKGNLEIHFQKRIPLKGKSHIIHSCNHMYKFIKATNLTLLVNRNGTKTKLETYSTVSSHNKAKGNTKRNLWETRKKRSQQLLNKHESKELRFNSEQGKRTEPKICWKHFNVDKQGETRLMGSRCNCKCYFYLALWPVCLLLWATLELLLWPLVNDPPWPILFPVFLWELYPCFPSAALATLSVSTSRPLCGLMGCLFRYTTFGRRLQTALRSWSSVILFWIGFPSRFRACSEL